ncbi:hypothetical protein ACLOJK_019093 [Asimina triloba]
MSSPTSTAQEKQQAFQPTAAAAEEKQQAFQPTAPAAEEKHQAFQPTAPAAAADESGGAEKWGTKYMGAPAAPTAHPHNQQAATWTAPGPAAAGEDQNFQQHQPHPYVMHSAVEKHNQSPLGTVLDTFNSWGKKAETLASNIWQNLKTGPSVSEAAWGKLNLTAKAITEGGFESLYKQTFPTEPNEQLKKTFACYLSTTTGPVAGTLYISNKNTAFCSDRPLCFTAPSGQQTWCYYKAFIPLGKIASINPVTMRENPVERYIQVTTVDGHDFWFMGFVNYEKACTHLSSALSQSRLDQLNCNFFASGSGEWLTTVDGHDFSFMGFVNNEKACTHLSSALSQSRLDQLNCIFFASGSGEWLTTVDGHDFWFMGFVNYEKACTHLSSALSQSRLDQLNCNFFASGSGEWCSSF